MCAHLVQILHITHTSLGHDVEKASSQYTQFGSSAADLSPPLTTLNSSRAGGFNFSVLVTRSLCWHFPALGFCFLGVSFFWGGAGPCVFVTPFHATVSYRCCWSKQGCHHQIFSGLFAWSCMGLGGQISCREITATLRCWFWTDYIRTSTKFHTHAILSKNT